MFILLAYAITAALAYFVVTQLFMEQPEVGAFNTALDKVRQDPRITVQLGETIKGAYLPPLPFGISVSAGAVCLHAPVVICKPL